MMRFTGDLWAGAVVAALLGLALPVLSATAAEKPNILFVLTDDEGWATLSCYGNKHVSTPHLDALARDGLKLTCTYATPQCTPTRATLLTGQHTARHRMWHVIPWYGTPGHASPNRLFRRACRAMRSRCQKG